MTKSELAVLFPALVNTDFFKRDTALLLQTLDGLEHNNKNVKALCDELESRREKNENVI